MTALALARRVRAALGAVALVRALAWGAGAAGALVAIAAVADLIVALPVALRGWVAPAATLAAAIAAALVVWRMRGARSPERVALWIEERVPTLHYALVTSLERERAGLAPIAFDAPRWPAIVRQSGTSTLLAPLLLLGAALALLEIVPATTRRRVVAPRAGDALARRGLGAASGRSRLAPLTARIAPPRYVAMPDSAVDEPSSIRALVGSTVTLAGRGNAGGIGASLRAASDSAPRGGETALTVVASNDRWSTTTTVGRVPAVITLHDGAAERLVAIEPVADAPPQATFVAPAHDSVLVAPRGRLPLVAELSDDHGLADARFELIVSAGEGENFTFRTTTLGARALDGRAARIESVLPLDSLALAPGSVLHLRVVARDRNDVSGPGIGASETRVLRVPRSDEGDSVAVEGAPPPEQRSVISQRMLIVLAEALQQRRGSLPRTRVLDESRGIAADQRTLRREVGALVFARAGGDATGEEVEGSELPANLTPEQLLARAEEANARDPSRAVDFEGGEAPVVAINRPLLEAYNAMWDAGSELEQGEPGRALPHMRRALAAIERARAAERVYLRGRVAAVVVDVAKARLAGKERGSPGPRTPRPAADSRLGDAEQRLARAVALVHDGASAGADSLLLLRIESLASNARYAAALGDAVAALRGGQREVGLAALARARRELAGAPVRADSLGAWQVAP